MRKGTSVKSLRREIPNLLLPDFRKLKVLIWGGRYPDASGCGTYSLWHWLTSHTLPTTSRPQNHASLYGRHNIPLSEHTVAELGKEVHFFIPHSLVKSLFKFQAFYSSPETKMMALITNFNRGHTFA